MITLLALLVGILGLMALAVPVSFSLMLASVAIIWSYGQPLMIVPQQIFAGIDSFTLLAVPLFLLAGDLMTMGGMTERLLAFANALVGRFRGGLAMSNVVASTMLSGISGSAVADTSAIGKVMIPGMVKAGYSPAFAAALTASANIVGPIIPPSIAFILIGVLANLSITRLFLAGIMPGILYATAMLITAGVISRRRQYPRHHAAGLPEILRTAKSAFFAILMPVLILVGIRSGVFNVTECSAMAVLYALIVGVVFHRELSLAKIWIALRTTARSTAVIMLVLGGAQVVSWLLAYEHIPQQIVAGMLSVSDNPLLFLLMVNVLLILVGTFMENAPSMVILVPVLYPIATAMGIDPIHFGVVMSVNLILGLLTPPVAIAVSIAAMIGKVTTEAAMKEVWPFFLVALCVQMILTYVPAISLFIPRLVMG